MEKDKIVIRLYEILNKENEGERIIGHSEGDGFDEGFEQGCYLEKKFFEREIKKLIKEIKN